MIRFAEGFDNEEDINDPYLDVNLLFSNLDDMERVVNDVWGLPLSVDPIFQMMSGLSDKYLEKWGKILIDGANNTTGRERLKYLRALNQLNLVTNTARYKKMITDLSITGELFSELKKRGENEAKEEK